MKQLSNYCFSPDSHHTWGDTTQRCILRFPPKSRQPHLQDEHLQPRTPPCSFLLITFQPGSEDVWASCRRAPAHQETVVLRTRRGNHAHIIKPPRAVTQWASPHCPHQSEQLSPTLPFPTPHSVWKVKFLPKLTSSSLIQFSEHPIRPEKLHLTQNPHPIQTAISKSRTFTLQTDLLIPPYLRVLTYSVTSPYLPPLLPIVLPLPQPFLYTGGEDNHRAALRENPAKSQSEAAVRRRAAGVGESRGERADVQMPVPHPSPTPRQGEHLLRGKEEATW